MTDVITRDLNQNASRAEPIAPGLGGPPSRVGVAPVAAKTRTSIFAADVPQGADTLGQTAALRALAELVAHRGAETPLTIGLLGAPGTGKSFALTALLNDVDSLSAAADETMVRRIAIVPIDATVLDGVPSVALAAAVYDKLSAVYHDFVREAAHAVRDPHVDARDAAHRLDEVRRRLDSERQSLEDIENRRGRLAESVLFESAGSQVDAYARTNRGKIESRLTSFGITGDPIANYKSMVRDVADAGGGLGRGSVVLRAFWAFAGQGKLLATAVVLFFLGIGFAAAVSAHDVWLTSFANSGKGFVPLASWLSAHIAWLSVAAKLAYLGAVAALAANILRGVLFLNPLFHGVRLLKADVANRRQALDQHYAHQTRRVDGLEADVDLAARAAAEADRRAGNAVRGTVQNEPSPFKETAAKPKAERFFASLASYLPGAKATGSPNGALSVPDRIVIALDNVDALPEAKSAALLDAAHRAFAHQGLICIVTLNPASLAVDTSLIDKWLQVPFRVDSNIETRNYAGFIAQTVSRSEALPAKKPLAPAHSWALAANESALLAALAPLAGGTPRAVKRLVNLYRIARGDAERNRGMLALFLALLNGGTPDEVGALRRALARHDDNAPLDLSGGGARLTHALDAAQSLDGLVTVGAARRTAALARTFSINADA